MKKLFIIILIGLLTFACIIAAVQYTNHKKVTVQKSTKKVMYHCPMHPTIISDKPGDCPVCGMHLVPINENHSDHDLSSVNMENADKSRIRIDPTTIQNMGVKTVTVENRSLDKAIRTSATLENSETGVYIITTKVMGYAEKLFVDFTGESVKKGQPLLRMYSPDLVNTQEEYLQAYRYNENLAGSSEFARKGAQELLESAKNRLLNWDISEHQIETIAKQGSSQKSITIDAPSNGVVMEKMVITGQKIEPGMPLYKLADLSRIWAIANIYQEDLQYVKVGMPAEIELTSLPGKTFKGKVQFISPILDEISKTAKVRIEIPNTSDYMLKPQMFASVKILSPVSIDGLAIPEQSILHSGTRTVVIVSQGNGYFKPQEIKTGASADGYTQVLEGLREGQTIVTSSQFLIDSESNLRAAVNSMMNNSASEKPAEHTETQKHSNMNSTINEHKSEVDVKHKKPVETPTQKTSETMYFCPMEPEVVSDKPDKCPKCGMDLIKKQ